MPPQVAVVIAAELVRRGARRHRDRTAVVVGDTRLSFAEVAATAEGLARALLGAGVTPGDRVALLLDNGRHSVPVDFAMLLVGLLRVPLNARLSDAELAQLVSGAGATVLVHEGRHETRALALAAAVPGLVLLPLDDTDGGTEPLLRQAGRQPDGDPGVRVGPDDVVLAVYTSGTTGTLKAALHTQRSWAAVAANILTNLVDPGPGDVMLHAASLIHASGAFVLPFWVRGAAAAVLPGFDPASWLAGVAAHRATHANLVPTMLQMLLASDALATADVSSLDTVIYGASPMPRPVIDAALARFGPVFTQYYGQTEAPLAITTLTKGDHVGPDAEALLGSCGMASVDAEVRLVDADGREVPDGDAGEMQVRAPFTMAGYLDAPELTAATLLADGWLATRDVARRDELGCYHLVDRTSDMIVTGGYNVYPREVEDALLSHPEVREAAVVGAPHEVWVEAVTAFVVLAPDAAVGAEDLQEHVRRRLAGHKVPKTVSVVDAIPKSPVGKVLRRALRDPLWGRA